MLALTIDLESSLPVYRQIADEIRSLVARGALGDGDELPSVRRLGAMVGVNQNTVAKAYRSLADEGLVELRHGAGAHVRVSAAPYRQAPADETERRLEEIVSRWVLAGVERREIEARLAAVLDRFFEKGTKR